MRDRDAEALARPESISRKAGTQPPGNVSQLSCAVRDPRGACGVRRAPSAPPGGECYPRSEDGGNVGVSLSRSCAYGQSIGCHLRRAVRACLRGF